MATGKTSFVLYCDIKHTIAHLTDEQAGKLFRHIVAYVNDENPETDDIVVKLAFEPVKQYLKRDLRKWEMYVAKQKVNGQLGGRPKNPSLSEKTQAFSAKPKKADSVSVSVSVSEGVAPQENFCNNAEETILANRIRFEQIMVKIGASEPVARGALRKYHLHLEEQDQYPKSKKAVFAGFEKWLMNEAAFTGQPVTETGGRRMVY